MKYQKLIIVCKLIIKFASDYMFDLLFGNFDWENKSSR